MQKKFFLMIGLLACWSAAGPVEIEVDGIEIGLVGGLILDADPDDPSRIVARLKASFHWPSLVQQIDSHLSARGNFNTCGNRVYWASGTTMRSVGPGATISFSSNVRYESWICARALFGFTTKLGQNTESLDWRLSLDTSQIDKIQAKLQVEGIDNMPPSIEEILGLRVGEVVKIPWPDDCGLCQCSEIQSALQPNVEGASFEYDGAETLNLHLEFAFRNDLGEILGCIRDSGTY